MNPALRLSLLLALIPVLTPACKPPPPAPEGLDDSTSYLIREFYSQDDMFNAGLQGFMNWYYEEGVDLLGLEVTLEVTEAFSVSELTNADLSKYPLNPQIDMDPSLPEDDPNRYVDRRVSQAKGVVSLAMMDCSWKEAEAYLVRPDQDTVFSEDWEGYERVYRSPREDFEGAAESEEFDPVAEELDPWAEDFVAEDFGRTLLLTENMPDPSTVLGSDLPAYPMNLDLRHGVYDLADAEGSTSDTGVLAIVTYMIDASWGPQGNTALFQSYSIEVNVEQPGDQTLRMLAVWAEPFSSGLDPGSPSVLNFAVNKSIKSSERMSAICSGDIEIPAE